MHFGLCSVNLIVLFYMPLPKFNSGLAYKLAHCPSRDFWAEVGRLSKPERRSSPLVVDGVTADKQIATLWANKLNLQHP